MLRKILIVGVFSDNQEVYTYANSFYNTFLKLEYSVIKFDYRKSYFSNLSLIFKVFTSKPDLVFFVKAEKIKPRTFSFLKKFFKVLLISFYPDNPFVFWNGNANSNVLNSLPLFNYFLIWSKRLVPILEMAGAKNVYYFPFAYDKDIFLQDIIFTDEDKKKYSSDVCFIGTWDLEREYWLTKLCEKMPELNLKIWGNLWHEKLPEESILRKRLIGKAIYGIQMIKAFKLSKIVLNFIRKQNMTSHNMRTFEVAASGAFLLAQRTLEQAELLFKEGESIECFGSIDELIDKIKFYLKNERAREDIKVESSLQVQKFTMQALLKEFMGEFGEKFKT